MGTAVKCDLLHIFMIWLHSGEENSHCRINLSGMGLFVTAHSSQPFRIHAIRANFTADRIKNSTEGRREKKTLSKTHSRLQKKKEKARNYWCLRRMGRDKAFLHRGVTRQWMHESGLFRSPLLELYSTLASWQKNSPVNRGVPPWPLTIVALVINRQQRGWPAAGRWRGQQSLSGGPVKRWTGRGNWVKTQDRLWRQWEECVWVWRESPEGLRSRLIDWS